LLDQEIKINKEERYSRVPQLLDNHYSAKIVEYLNYQISVTQLKRPKGNGDMQAAKQDQREMEICKQQSENEINGDMQAVKRY